MHPYSWNAQCWDAFVLLWPWVAKHITGQCPRSTWLDGFKTWHPNSLIAQYRSFRERGLCPCVLEEVVHPVKPDGNGQRLIVRPRQPETVESRSKIV